MALVFQSLRNLKGYLHQLCRGELCDDALRPGHIFNGVGERIAGHTVPCTQETVFVMRNSCDTHRAVARRGKCTVFYIRHRFSVEGHFQSAAAGSRSSHSNLVGRDSLKLHVHLRVPVEGIDYVGILFILCSFNP